ncbi:hypothetical protein GF339_20415, partial [candidate division KSB3 bacterium]|nr:hypothetical protein [candidate division KSB3 bacterium]MBD3326961.1 hypothetical protein [candidate division KSB3 bacterium]
MMGNSIFIYGILPRSGTNFLNHMVLLHADCVQSSLKVRENYFLHHSDSLWQYAEQLFQTWSNPKWKGEAFSQQTFFAKIGEALLTYLTDQSLDISTKILVSKTPSVQHLDRCFDLFPHSKIILIVRDARDIAASTFKTWGTPIPKTLDKWNIACQMIAQFERGASAERYLLLRYEDLMDEREVWMQKCLNFLGLDGTKFLWNELNALPI